MAVLLEAAPVVLLAFISLSAVVIPLAIIVNLLIRLTSNASLPSDLPWAGMDTKGGRWSRLKANLTSILNLKSLINEGYAKVGYADTLL
jgi:hypothetical protein